jgi:hypothetical protein
MWNPIESIVQCDGITTGYEMIPLHPPFLYETCQRLRVWKQKQGGQAKIRLPEKREDRKLKRKMGRWEKT